MTRVVGVFEHRVSATADVDSDRFAMVLMKQCQELAPDLFGNYQIVCKLDNREVAVTAYWKV